MVLTCFTNDLAYRRFATDISCCDNCFYSLYKSANAEKHSGIPDWKLHDVIMRHSLRYLKTNEQYRHQENIAIVKKIDICIARFILKESEKIHGHSQARQASIAVERITIIK